MHRDALVVVDQLGVGEAKDGSHRLGRLVIVDLPIGQKGQLVEFLLQGHLSDEGVDTSLDRGAFGESRTRERGTVAGEPHGVMVGSSARAGRGGMSVEARSRR